MHPDDDALQALMDGELPAQRSADARVHLAACAGCRDRMTAIHTLTEDTFRVLSTLDVGAPAVSFDAIVRRRGRGARQPNLRRWALAAVVAFTVSGLAFAAPRSPVREWLRSFFHTSDDVRVPVTPRPAPAAPPRSRSDGRDLAGVAVVPGRSLRIDFETRQSAGDIAITMTDSAAVTVSTAAGTATFTSSPTVLVVHNAGSAASFDVRIPHEASRIEIRVGGRRVYLRDGASDAVGGVTDSVGVRRISLVETPSSSQTRR